MTAAMLARLVADALSGPTRLGNTRRYGGLIRANWSKMDELWRAAGLGKRAPLACNLNLPGMTAEGDHHPIAARLREFAGAGHAVPAV